jgi:phosphate starvation-inducible membrane PsiE
MKNHFLSRFDADNLRKAIIYFVIALSLIIISLVLGIENNGLATFMFLIGITFFFYSVLRPWGKASYYAILGGISLILIIFEFLAGIGIVEKMQLKLAEDIALITGFSCVAGMIAGIIGIFRFRKYD